MAEEPCHQSCSEFIEKQIREVVLKIHDSVQVETVIFQEISSEENPVPLNEDQEKNKKDTFTHRFLVTVSVPCQQGSLFGRDSYSNDPYDIPTLDVIFNGNGNGTDAGFLETNVYALPPKVAFTDSTGSELTASEEISTGSSDDMETQIDSGVDLSYFEELVETDTNHLAVRAFPNDHTDSCNQVFFPLSNGELHEAITEQLDKATPHKLTSWSSSLFKDVPTTSIRSTSQIQPDEGETTLDTSVILTQMALPQQQQQSNEISSSSSTWESFAKSTSRQHCTTILPQMSTQTLYFDPNAPVTFTETNQLNLSAISCSQNQSFCPANLPAVSALLAGGSIGGCVNWSVSGASNTTFMRLAKQLHPKDDWKENLSFRPKMLLPRTAVPLSSTTRPSASRLLPTSDSTPRGRKSSPTILKPVTSTYIPDSAATTGAPNGHTYESWIIQEGLIKVRQEMKRARKTRAASKRLKDEQELKFAHTQDKEDKDTAVTNTGTPKKAKAARYVCPICGKAYGSANGIKYHAENGHGPKNIFTCDICNKDYASRHGLAAHKRTHEIRAAEAALERDCLRYDHV